jgi:hypothetical protein
MRRVPGLVFDDLLLFEEGGTFKVIRQGTELIGVGSRRVETTLLKRRTVVGVLQLP